MEKSKRTQINDVKKYLKTHKKGLTPQDAEDMFGSHRLAAIIHTLRHREGMNIITIDECVKNRYGTISHYARYKLV